MLVKAKKLTSTKSEYRGYWYAEVWKPVAGRFEGYEYEVSNWGRVKSCTTFHKRPPRIMTPFLSHDGYHHVALSKNSRKTRVNIHILVAEAFLGPRLTSMVVNHKDGDKLNNNPENLEWVTRSENDLHAFRHKLRTPARKVSDDTAKEIKRLNLEAGISKAELARRFNISETNVYNIVYGVSYKNI